MFHTMKYEGTLKERYETVQKQLEALIDNEQNMIANFANCSALLQLFLDDINWVGFYLVEEGKDELVLGPFQGMPACIRIPFNRGVCGHAATTKKTIIVPDVHLFKGHIACDGATQSEVVIPILKNGHLIGVLDIDSPIKNRFSEEEAYYLEKIVNSLEIQL